MDIEIVDRDRAVIQSAVKWQSSAHTALCMPRFSLMVLRWVTPKEPGPVQADIDEVSPDGVTWLGCRSTAMLGELRWYWRGAEAIPITVCQESPEGTPSEVESGTRNRPRCGVTQEGEGVGWIPPDISAVDRGGSLQLGGHWSSPWTWRG